MERLFVSVRLRPLNGKEISSNDVSDWECINNHTIVYNNATSQYKFDRVFGSDCSTRRVYDEGAKNVAISVVHGVNSTVFAYGQTGSGKTYTMTGITEYAITDIYDYIHKHPERELVLKFSAMEIHNESVRDLLSLDSTPLRLVDDPEVNPSIVENLTEEILRDRDHATELLFICEAHRRTEETSHQIIRLRVESSGRNGDNASIHAASLNLVDLAGSEQADPSLLTFATVIRKLRNNKELNGNIPYRDSKLTQILETSLRGNARTALLCTMSPARSHVEQSRNTLHFAKEVTINPHVDVGMPDSALVKHLQDEITRLENELRSSQLSSTSLNYSALLREKDAQIEKLEKEVKELILEREISQSRVKELSRMLGEDASSITRVRSIHYPHLRVHISPDRYNQELETCDPQCDELSRNSSRYHNAKIPYFDENSDQHNASPNNLPSSSSYSESDSFYGLQEIEKLIRGNLEDLCSEVGRLEAEQSRNRETPEPILSYSEDKGEFPAIKVHVKDDDNEENENILSGSTESKEGQELTSASLEQGTESTSLMLAEESSIQYPDNASLTDNRAEDSFGNRRFKVARSISSGAGTTFADSASPWYCQNTPYNGSVKVGQSRLENGQDITENFSTADDCTTCTPDMREEDATKLRQFPMKNVKFDELDLKEDEIRLTSWPVEFRKLRREMIELWHACNISLVHRSYFFLLFQGDPSDAIYLEVEIRRTKALKDKFSRGDKIVVDGRRLTLSSSAKALRQERRMLSEHMMKKFTEHEREKLFMEWGIGLSTKLRRLQLAHLIWSKTDDVNHIAESTFLVAKLAGFIDPEQTPSREMFGVNFTPKSSTGMGTFKRSLGLGSLL
ncbi:hypothetical protein ACS0TY_031388 [Phlomoides rotata]